MAETIAVLFVCMGNICRSPAAEGIFRAKVARAGLADRIVVDSAGTGGWHAGDPPDTRMQAAASRRGYDLSDQHARKVQKDDGETFDLIVAMDRDNLRQLKRLCAPSARLHLFTEFAPGVSEDDVPDPYYGGGDGFELVLDLIEEASDGLLRTLQRELGS